MKSPRLWDAVDHISHEGATEGSRIVPEGAVLLLVRGMGLARDLPVAVIKRAMAFNQDLKALVPKTALSGSFIRHAIYHSREKLMSRIVPSAHGTMTLNLDDVTTFQIPVPQCSDVALAVGDSLDCVLDAIAQARDQLLRATELKDAALSELFSRGLRGEAQKETEIGLVPESWGVERLDSRARVVSTRTSYTELESSENARANTVRVVGIKVSDMNRVGNETVMVTAALEKLIDAHVATYRCAPPGTIVFPKRGAAIATNKKRLTDTWSVFDPNVIGVVPNDKISARFLFHWFQSFDLRTITEPGPTPQLNKKHLDPLPIPVPQTMEEQEEIAAILDAIDRKIALHRQKRNVLDELFNSLLHKVMTGEIRVADLDLSTLHSQEVAA